MNWYKRQLKIAMSGRGGKTQKSNKWEEVESNKETIQNLLDEGYSKKEVADLFGVGYQLFVKMLNRFKIYRSIDVLKQKAKEMHDKGFPLDYISRSVKTDHNRISKILNLKTRDMNYASGNPIRHEEGKEMIRLHTEESMRPTQIAKIMNRPHSSVKTYLDRAGVYQRLRGDWVRFNPTEEQMRQIDYWYALPPEGEGKSMAWIADQFGLLDQQMGYWFRKTGRPTRTFQEQANTSFSKKRMSEMKLKEWEQKGGLEGYLKSLPVDKAIRYLEQFVQRIKQTEGNDAAFAIRTKYRNIIDENNRFQKQIERDIPYELV